MNASFFYFYPHAKYIFFCFKCRPVHGAFTFLINSFLLCSFSFRKRKEIPGQSSMQRFYETNRLNFKGDAIGPFDRLNECIRTYLLGNGENEKRFLEGLPTVMFFQLGFQEPMILCVTRRDFIDHTPRDAA